MKKIEFKTLMLAMVAWHFIVGIYIIGESNYIMNRKNKHFMNWISIEEKTPQEGEQVLVIGYLRTELGGRRKEKSVGLVNWENAEKSDCSDYCYYELEYQDITHWHPITLP